MKVESATITVVLRINLLQGGSLKTWPEIREIRRIALTALRFSSMQF